MKQYPVTWGEKKLLLSFHKAVLPDVPCTSAHGFIFNSRGELLLIGHQTRGVDIPGGHIEPGETSEAAFIRELGEEAYVNARFVTPVGSIRIENPDHQAGSQYPAISQQPFFAGILDQEFPFKGEMETHERVYVSAETLSCLYRNWNQALSECYKESLIFRDQHFQPVCEIP